MNRALADQVKLFREQAGGATGTLDLEDELAFGIFLFDRLRQIDERFRLDVAQPPELDAAILGMYRQWGEAANHCLSALAALQAKGFSIRGATEFRRCCQEARGVLATEIAYPPPSTENPKKESLEELLSRVTEENRHGEIDFGPPVGKEAW